MKTSRLLSFLLLVLSASITEASDQIFIEVDIFQIQTDISGETSLTDYVWPSKIEEEEAKENKLTFFTKAKFKLQNEELALDEKTWSDQAGFKECKGLASPRFLVQQGREFEMNIGSDEKTEYFEAREDGLYELKTLPESIGLSVKSQVLLEGQERILLKDLTFLFRTIEGREELKGSQSGQFGKPIVKEKNLTTTLNLKPQTNYGILASSEGQGALLIRLRVEKVNEGK